MAVTDNNNNNHNYDRPALKGHFFIQKKNLRLCSKTITVNETTTEKIQIQPITDRRDVIFFSKCKLKIARLQLIKPLAKLLPVLRYCSRLGHAVVARKLTT